MASEQKCKINIFAEMDSGAAENVEGRIFVVKLSWYLMGYIILP